MPVICVVANKGGSGKTTTSIQLADALSLQGYRTLLVDADERATTSAWRQVRMSKKLKPPAFDVMAVKSPTLSEDIPSLQRKSTYDWILIDCPPGSDGEGDQMVRSALTCADLVILPVIPSGLDFWNAPALVRLLLRLQTVRPAMLIRVLINRKTSSTRLGKSARKSIESLGLPLFRAEIPMRAAIVESISRGLTISEFSEKSKWSEHCYGRLAEEVIECLQMKTMKSLSSQ